jgi:hypothetical protein
MNTRRSSWNYFNMKICLMIYFLDLNRIPSGTQGSLPLPDIDITAQIKIIESLKCALLSDIAALYENMRVPAKQNERDENLAALLIHTYLLAGRLGLKYDQLDEQARQRLKREAMAQSTHPDISALLKYFCEVNP